MKEEFNLSEKRYFDNITSNIDNQVYREEDVKEFIKRLKDPDSKVNPTHFCGKTGVFRLSEWWEEIDKLAGEKLK